jgi:glycosyltransferase involved in cell wall biosynthesis
VRIAYLINQYPSVSHSFIRREILALERLGFEIMRLSLRGWDHVLVDEADQAERKRTRYVLRVHSLDLLFSVLRMSLARPIRLMRAIAMAWHMSRESDRPFYVHLIYVVEACRITLWLRKEDVTHLHAHFGTNSAEVAMLAHILGGLPWSFTAHGTESFDNPRLVGLSEKVLRCAFAVAVSIYGRAQLYRCINPKHWHKIHVVHCGLDPMFREFTDFSPASAQRIICVGRLSPEKGHLILLEAAHRLATEGYNFELILAGDGELRRDIEAQILQHKLTDRVRITGWISNKQVSEELLAARVLVVPSLGEGLPVVIMEAMALRRPVIATMVGGIPELVRPGEDGWLVPPSDVAGLAEAMRACLEASSQQIDRMGKSARERVLESHDVDEEAKRLRELFVGARSLKN